MPQTISSFLREIVKRSQTWPVMAAKYGVDNPLPPWKTSLDGLCDVLDTTCAADGRLQFSFRSAETRRTRCRPPATPTSPTPKPVGQSRAFPARPRGHQRGRFEGAPGRSAPGFEGGLTPTLVRARTLVPAEPSTILSMSASEPITASLPVSRGELACRGDLRAHGAGWELHVDDLIDGHRAGFVCSGVPQLV